jgi:hypothetical protein
VNRYKYDEKVSANAVVVGIIPTYKDIEIYTIKQFADRLITKDVNTFESVTLEQDNLSFAKNRGQNYFFNGLFSKSDSPNALTNTSIYSPTGLYPASDKFSQSSLSN